MDKLKHHLILGLDVVEKYRIGLDWDMYWKLFLRCQGRKIATSMKINNLDQHTGKQNKTEKKLHLITSNTVTIPPYHISITPLKAIKQTMNNNIKPNNLTEIEVKPFLATEQPESVLIPML